MRNNKRKPKNFSPRWLVKRILIIVKQIVYWKDNVPTPGRIRWGSLRRLKPIDYEYGLRRGTPIDRYYIEKFLNTNRHLIKGRVLEVGDNFYTHRFGGDQVTQSDILDVESGKSSVTIVDDLTKAESIPRNAFDCFICTQTLHYIPDTQAALKNIYQLLKPGGVFLGSVPGITYHNPKRSPWSYFSMFTRWSANWHFTHYFHSNDLEIISHGNVLTSIAFLHGLAQEELTKKELDTPDDYYQFLITIKATKHF